MPHVEGQKPDVRRQTPANEDGHFRLVMSHRRWIDEWLHYGPEAINSHCNEGHGFMVAIVNANKDINRDVMYYYVCT